MVEPSIQANSQLPNQKLLRKQSNPADVSRWGYFGEIEGKNEKTFISIFGRTHKQNVVPSRK